MRLQTVCTFFLFLNSFKCDEQVNVTTPPETLNLLDEPCINGFAYHSMEICQCYCFFNFGSNNTCPGRNKAVNAYKNHYLNKTEYEITPEGSLIVTDFQGKVSKTYFSKEEFFQHDDNFTVVLCYPMQSEYHNCVRQTIPFGEFELEKDKSVYVKRYDKHYAFDLYKKNFDGIAICQLEAHQAAMIIITIGFCCSTLCLVATFILSLFILNRLSNFALICYIGMLCCYCALNVIYYLRPMNFYKEYFCPALPLLSQYSFLSALVWMNIHVCTIYLSFSKLYASSSKGSVKGYLIRCSCGWGVPILFTVITLTMDLVEDPFLKPNFFTKCTFDVDGASYFFMHGPVCISLVLNVAVFVAIVIKAKKLAKDASAVNKNASKQMIHLAVKLIVIMGFCYITKLIYWGVRVFGSFWAYFDIISTLQGVYVFIVYVCNARTLKLLKDLCSHKKPEVSATSTTTIVSNETPL